MLTIALLAPFRKAAFKAASPVTNIVLDVMGKRRDGMCVSTACCLHAGADQ